MAELSQLAWGSIALVAIPLAVGLLLGLDRKLTARMQGRVGPPLWQPFYDLAKLLGKERRSMNPGQAGFALVALLLQALALAMLVYGGDMMAAFFLTSAGSAFIVLGAFSARSPFSHLGAQRELLQILAYEPVLFLAVLAMGYVSGSFSAAGLEQALLYTLPLALAALVPVLVIKMQKSPYDIAHAHTEVVSGPQVEYSGPYLAVVELAHWLELGVLLWFMAGFWYDPDPVVSLAGKAALVLVAVFLVVLIDNSSTRLTRDRMVSFALTTGVALVTLNLVLVLYIFPEVGW